MLQNGREVSVKKETLCGLFHHQPAICAGVVAAGADPNFKFIVGELTGRPPGAHRPGLCHAIVHLWGEEGERMSKRRTKIFVVLLAVFECFAFASFLLLFLFFLALFVVPFDGQDRRLAVVPRKAVTEVARPVQRVLIRAVLQCVAQRQITAPPQVPAGPGHKEADE